MRGANSSRMDFFELIKARRSIRTYTTQQVEEEKITAILEAANHAPSAGNLQAYVVVVVRKPALKQALSKAAYNQESVANAPVVLAFFAHQEVSAAKYHNRGKHLYSLQDASIACAYAQLAAASLKLGCVWVGAFDDDQVRHILHGDDDWLPVALMPIGYAAEKPEKPRRRPVRELTQERH